MQVSQKRENLLTTCSYCGVGCGIEITKERDGKISLAGNKNYPVNEGMLCSKGMSLHHVVSDTSDRLLHPQMRKNKNYPLERVTWDQALDRAAAVFKSLIKNYGANSVGLYVSGQLLTEEYYIANKLTKGFFKTNNIDTNSRLCMSSAVVGYKKALGEDSVPINYDDIELADCFFITGANPAWCHPIIFRRIENHKNKNPQVKIIVVDPRKTASCEVADLHLQLVPGSDVTLYNAIARYLIENNLIDKSFIENHLDGFNKLQEAVFEKTLEESAAECQLVVADIILAAKYIGNAKGFISMWAMGLNQSSMGVNKNLALINLSLITGQIGKPGCGPFSLTGQPNAMGGREVGGLSNMLAVHKDFTNPQHVSQVEKFWDVTGISNQPGLTATEMFEALEKDELKAIWIICTNPMVSMPNSNLIERSLKKARFVIVQDISSRSDTLEYADLVFPAAGWLEKEGTMTNSERRISHLEKVIDSPGEAKPDVEIMLEVAKRMGFTKAFNYNNVSEIYKEHAALTKGTNLDISHLDYSIIKESGSVQWPYKKNSTKRLFTDHKFFTQNGKANVFAVEDTNFSEKTTINFPLVLTTGRIRDQWHTMTRTGKVNKLTRHTPKPFLEIHPKDAKKHFIENDDIVKVFNQRGKVIVKVKITTKIKEGVVFLPMHWGKIFFDTSSRANNITSTNIDPISKEPDFKYSAVNMSKVEQKTQKIIVIGAGSASYKFIEELKQQDNKSEVTVFNKESNFFYNRIFLPDYITQEKKWDSLKVIEKSKIKNLNINLQNENEIIDILPQQSMVVDKYDNQHHYDKLIIASGSQPFIPSNIPKIKGIFSLRSKKDADAITDYLLRKSKVLIVGAGLLGLELASSLNEIGKNVTILQRSELLMSKQLDSVANLLLQEEILDLGITLIMQNSIKRIVGNEIITGVRLANGSLFDCDAIVFAIGTKPNIDFIKNTDMETNNGIVVNSKMQTNYENIFAIGEVAEFQGSIFGIAKAAYAQAKVAADICSGKTTSSYSATISLNILKIKGVELCAIGNTKLPSNSIGYEEIIFVDKGQRVYKKCFLQNDRLVGAILLGDTSEMNSLISLIENKEELDDLRKSLLRSTSGSRKEIKGDIVCSCNRVGAGNINDEIKSGVNDFETLCNNTGAGLGCGSCKPEVKAILEVRLTEV